MKNDRLLNGAAAFISLGLFIGLPELNTFLIDFSQFDAVTTSIFRLGFFLITIYFLDKASGGASV